jgi:nucleotide-binding universal stress UspA family protein
MGRPPDTARLWNPRRCRKADREVREMTGPVICGVDGASDTVGAAGVARELARRYELPLLYVHVLDERGSNDDAEQLLGDAAAQAPAELAIENGHPADRLLALARERQASFLVVGNHGPRSSLLGSISADVSRRASCPVVVVPPTAEIAQPQAADSNPEVEGGIVRFGLDHAVRRVA